MASSTEKTTPYAVKVRKKVNRFIDEEIREPQRKAEARQAINDLQNYPSVLGRWDIEKVKGRENTYRVRIGRYRIGFVVDKAMKEIEVADAVTK